MPTTETSIQVRYAETDAMGVVNHANYLTWLEVGRVNFLDQVGMSYRSMEESGYRLPVLEAHLSYKQSARFHDIVRIKTTIDAAPTVRLRIFYELYREDTLLCTAETMHTFINLEGRPVRPPSNFFERLAKQPYY